MSSTNENKFVNIAAWQTTSKSTNLEVKAAPYTSPGPNEITIRVFAVAINPVDREIQEIGSFIVPWAKYPAVLGSDVAGEVVEIGPGITRFKVGDRVTALAVGMNKKYTHASKGAFQQYVVLLEHMTTQIPGGMGFEQAAVMPLGLCTAACGLFQEDQLALSLPVLEPKTTGKTLLVWGASSSVGCNAIQ